MKNKLIALLLAAIMAVAFTGCASVERDYDSTTSMFVRVESVYRGAGYGWEVYYHRETKVMYVRATHGAGSGTWTVMLNPDGKPLLWEETHD